MIIHFHLLLIIIHNMFFHKKCMFGFYLLLFPCLLLMLNVNYHNDQDAHGKEQDRKYICRKLTSCMVRKTTDKFILKIVELSKVFFFSGDQQERMFLRLPSMKKYGITTSKILFYAFSLNLYYARELCISRKYAHLSRN